MIRAIFAADNNGGIGKKGTIPWPKNSHDLQWFRECTEGHIVMMGRKTWEDPKLPKPLPNRYNIVVSNSGINSNDTRPNIVIDRNKVKTYLDTIEKDVWIIGGAKLLNSTINYVEEIWVSRIYSDYKCDTFIELSTLFYIFETHSYFEKNLHIEKYKRKNI